MAEKAVVMNALPITDMAVDAVPRLFRMSGIAMKLATPPTTRERDDVHRRPISFQLVPKMHSILAGTSTMPRITLLTKKSPDKEPVFMDSA